MRPTPGTRLLTALVALGLALASPVRGDDLPPKQAKSFTAVYHLERRYRNPPDDPEWKTLTDTVTIAVDGQRSRWDYKHDGRTILYDYAAQTSTEYGGSHAPNTAVLWHYKGKMPMPIGFEFGFGRSTLAEGAKPVVTGTATVAGKPCTRVVVESDDYGKPDFCVTAEGIVLRYENRGLNDGAVYEAQSVTLEAPAPERLKVPEGYQIEDRSAGFGR